MVDMSISMIDIRVLSIRSYDILIKPPPSIINAI